MNKKIIVLSLVLGLCFTGAFANPTNFLSFDVDSECSFPTLQGVSFIEKSIGVGFSGATLFTTSFGIYTNGSVLFFPTMTINGKVYAAQDIILDMFFGPCFKINISEKLFSLCSLGLHYRYLAGSEIISLGLGGMVSAYYQFNDVFFIHSGADVSYDFLTLIGDPYTGVMVVPFFGVGIHYDSK